MSGSPHSAAACIQAPKASLCQAEWEGGARGCELLPVTRARLLSFCHMHTHTHGAHRKCLMAGTYRDEDGLIEQLRGRVKHVEEESLLVQGERGTDEGPLSLGPGGDGHRPASGAGPHSECAVGSTQHQALGIQPHGSGHLKDRVAIPTDGGGMEQGEPKAGVRAGALSPVPQITYSGPALLSTQC